MSSEFRFVYSTPLYDETVAFLRDALGLAVTGSWEFSKSSRRLA